MKSIAMLDDSQSNTVVITTVGILKSAFLEWADELAQSREEAERDVMIDEAVVIRRLRRVGLLFGDGMPVAIFLVTSWEARISTSNRM